MLVQPFVFLDATFICDGHQGNTIPRRLIDISLIEKTKPVMADIDNLIRAAQNGDEASFEQLLDHCYDVMYRYALKWCGNNMDAEDITQQACIKLAKNIRQFNFQAAFSSWLYRLVINCAKDWQRTQTRHDHDDIAKSLETQTQTHAEQNAAHNRIYLQQLLSMIATMGEGFRETVVLVLGEGLSHREAATILSVKESTISWRIHEVRKQLSLRNEVPV